MKAKIAGAQGAEDKYISLAREILVNQATLKDFLNYIEWQKRLDPFIFGDESKYLTVHFNYQKRPAVIGIATPKNNTFNTPLPFILPFFRSFHTSSVNNAKFSNRFYNLGEYITSSNY